MATLPYVPTPDIFVDGTVIDAADFINEFEKIATATKGIQDDLKNGDENIQTVVIQYVDDKIKELTVDGGTF